MADTASANLAVEYAPSTDRRGLLLGFTAPAGPDLLIFTGMNKEDLTNFGQDASSLSVGYLCSLSRRIGLHAVYMHINNHNGTGDKEDAKHFDPILHPVGEIMLNTASVLPPR